MVVTLAEGSVAAEAVGGGLVRMGRTHAPAGPQTPVRTMRTWRRGRFGSCDRQTCSSST
ncbi:hypothetical protein RKD18_008027 [Streptomyces phaeoluteigriseus]